MNFNLPENDNFNSEKTVSWYNKIPGFKKKLIDNSYQTHTLLSYDSLAFETFLLPQKFILLTLVLSQVVSNLIFGLKVTAIILVTTLTIVYFLDLLFNLFLILRSFHKFPEIDISDKEIDEAKMSWPLYTIFCPLYKEAAVLPQFIEAINNIDYPKDKLEVILLLEEDDNETIKKAKEIQLPNHFLLSIIPHSHPKTKPKALNFGLLQAHGEYAVIYDAEDIPDPKQLKKAIVGFNKVGPKVICLQAKLNFYNPHQNVLTRIFTAEYSLWFDLILTGLQSINAPIPLGGTSNHFRVQELKLLQGWDPFNVTEDCDLGIRLFKKGYRTAILHSTTLEEANSNFFNWFKQRSRWIKGYMQTYFVHMRRPSEFITDWKNFHIVSFQLIVGGKFLSILINPLMWVITISYFVFRSYIGSAIESIFPTPVFYMAIFSLVIGNFLYFYYYMVGCAKREQWDIIPFVVFVPFYWLMISIAAWLGIFQLIFKPHYWEKTVHGLHLNQGSQENKLSLTF